MRWSSTEKGELYLPTVAEAFDRLRESTDRLKGIDGGAVLTISALPNFALRWLVPRLPRFAALHPAIRLKLLTAPRPLEALYDEIDVAIRFDGEAAHLNFEPLLRGSMFPVMHPALYEDERLRTPQDLRRATLLHVLNSLSDWQIWLDAAGVKRVDVERGPRFDSYALAAEAACHRWGVAMAWEPFIEDDLRRGRLVAPFELRIPRERAWCLVYPPQRAQAEGRGVPPVDPGRGARRARRRERRHGVRAGLTGPGCRAAGRGGPQRGPARRNPVGAMPVL